MKKIFSLLLLLNLFVFALSLQAEDIVQVKQTKTPILIDRTDNVLFYIRVDAKNSKELNQINLRFSESVNIYEIAAIKLFYSGTEAPQRMNQFHYAPIGQYVSSHSPGNTLKANSSY